MQISVAEILIKENSGAAPKTGGSIYYVVSFEDLFCVATFCFYSYTSSATQIKNWELNTGFHHNPDLSLITSLRVFVQGRP